ncbi:MAG: hypothetical protein HC877_10215 [Thioploca sp.]|nr:hypothetical protein [Thioploca sp.]
MMKKKLQFKFSLLTRRQGFISLTSCCSLIALITTTLPAYSAQWLESSDPKCEVPVKAGGTACACLEIKNSELPKELKDSKTPVRYKWFRYIGTKPFLKKLKTPKNHLLMNHLGNHVV